MTTHDRFDLDDELYLAGLKARTASGKLDPIERAAQRQDERTRRMLAWRNAEKARREF